MTLSAGGDRAAVPWYADSVIYELHLRAFFDGNRDGIGDFKGATEKLDYLVELGVTTLWLLPFYPSPLRDAGYDISDYLAVHPDYGSLYDFRRFLSEAHARGLRVIVELVLNHTSDRHPWFDTARRAPPGSVERDRYVWSNSPERFREARIIFQDFERSNWSWDPVARAYYWHRFYGHQPDLNYDSPSTQRAMISVAEFWLGLGVDGLRLDAVPYLYEREGTSCENLPETHAFLKHLRTELDRRFSGRVLLAEANQWPEEAARYFGNGDECHLAFHFPLMPRMFTAIQTEVRSPLVDILSATPPIPADCRWALFLRNHDELTLEMVTDEERDYLYRTYARDARGRVNLGIRRRLAPLMGGDRAKIELMELLLFTLPGTPVIYYGDEILMGDDATLGDRDSVRTPMQWNRGRNAGFSRARAGRLYLPIVSDPDYRPEVVNVEGQQRNLASHLWWMKRLIRMRRRLRTLGNGRLQVLEPENPRLFAFLRRGEEDVLVAANLAASAQAAEFDLSAFEGRVPVDVFSGARFAPLRRGSLPLAFGPHGYYVLLLAPAESTGLPEVPSPYRFALERSLSELWSPANRQKLETEVLPAYLSERSWFEARGRSIDFVRLRDVVPLGPGAAPAGGWIAVVDVFYASGPPEAYAVPLRAMSDPARPSREPPATGSIVARLDLGETRGRLCDDLDAPTFRCALVRIAREGGSYAGTSGSLEGRPVSAGPTGSPRSSPSSEGSSIRGTVVFRRRLPGRFDAEAAMARRLTEIGFVGTSPLLGGVVYVERGADPQSLALVFGSEEGEADVARETEEDVVRFLTDVRASVESPPFPLFAQVDAPTTALPDELRSAVGESALRRLADLGALVGRFHLCLVGPAEDPTFAPVAFEYLYQASLSYSLSTQLRKLFAKLRSPGVPGVGENLDVEAIVGNESALLRRAHQLTAHRFDSVRILTHGSLSIETVRRAGNRLVLTGYGREPVPVKRSSLRDVASLVRSLQYLCDRAAERFAGPPGRRAPSVDAWAHLWYRAAARTVFDAYESVVEGSRLVPPEREARTALLETFLLERCVVELLDLLARPPGRWELPARALRELLSSQEGVPPGR